MQPLTRDPHACRTKNNPFERRHLRISDPGSKTTLIHSQIFELLLNQQSFRQVDQSLFSAARVKENFCMLFLILSQDS